MRELVALLTLNRHVFSACVLDFTSTSVLHLTTNIYIYIYIFVPLSVQHIFVALEISSLATSKSELLCRLPLR